MKNVLISSCLYGEKCRYDGKDSLLEGLDKIKQLCKLFPVCPEVLGGLSTPRNPSEIVGERIVMNNGKDVTHEYKKGAKIALETAIEAGCCAALMKAKSPSCGNGKVYDGTFSKTLTEGDGITVRLLRKNGIRVFDETQIVDFLKYISEEEK